MSRIGTLVGLAVGGLVVLCLLWPSPIDPVGLVSPTIHGPLPSPPTPEYRHPIETTGWLPGPEDVDRDGRKRLYTGLEDGRVVRFESGSGMLDFEVFARTGGRPLGLDFDGGDTLWVADAVQGLVSVDPSGRSRVRCSTVAGHPIHFANDVVVGADGRVYFSDASTRFGSEEIALEALEGKPHGRLVRFDPESGNAVVLLEDLYFANGVAVSGDGTFVLVAETFRYRIRRYWLKGPRTASDEILVEDLPGFPDGISVTGRGTFWVAINRRRSRLLDSVLHPLPWLKRQIAKLPPALLKDRGRYGLMLEIDSDGRILRIIEDPSGTHFHSVASVEELEGRLYFASIRQQRIGVLSISP